MKSVEKALAIELRHSGMSIKGIAKKIGVAKSSVSIWVRHVELTGAQKMHLLNKGRTLEEIERRRITRLKNEKAKRDVIIDGSKKSVSKIGNRQLWLIGLMLYWGEGGKTRRTVRFSNSDPDLIKIMMLFFRNICLVPEDKFRAHIHIHETLDFKNAEDYWANISAINIKQFYTTYRKPNKSSLNKKNSLPYGTMDIYVLDTQLFYKIVGWTRGVAERLIREPTGVFSSQSKYMNI